jgi:protein SCO1/2
MIFKVLFFSAVFISTAFTTVAISAVPTAKKDSIFVVKTQWMNQNSKSVIFSDFSGEKFILGMVYTSCGRSCPLTVSKIQELIRKSGQKNIKVVLASFDSQRDTPDHLLSYMKSRKLDDKIWTMITASDDQKVRELANILGINYKRDSDGEFTHSNVLTLIGSSGEILKTLEGFESNSDDFVKLMKTIQP